MLCWAILLTSQKIVARKRQTLASAPLRCGRAQAQIYSPGEVGHYLQQQLGMQLR